MPAKDIFHDAVRIGLEKEGWVITDDPLKIEVGDVEMYIDLGAEQVLAAEREGEKIAVEIKSFIGTSNISQFHQAIGQFFNYHLALEEQQPERVLYLAVPSGIYYSFFQLQFIKTVVQRSQLKIMIYDPVQEVIVAWKN
ncbi:XisH family protein [Dolichospermum sp. ST_con]|nr:XisH family protein [Dolichospermum sp. ST_con]MDD1419610.1 XisH family protein [Dolichospermum sp. ST_sed1]MDD1422906.1 XisH family protein [Dolichospermum sp. ST_sed9]MDD1430661.1 XisH family protein [Dolichospermum sp. ST_sed6]MDD1438199.1 XisH family protein [Dolichospermum sp. ST_sed10]MDD1439455.1 XisH family protein [Dolichospermum sp. ST_sed3]MDD1445850.1 XisH family protein [Dolichospermum sp. ST_sed8]MDD1453913.1 XisH family protein [Dolichospermum sp. ST_sed7]MDD1459876.1 XisH